MNWLLYIYTGIMINRLYMRTRNSFICKCYEKIFSSCHGEWLRFARERQGGLQRGLLVLWLVDIFSLLYYGILIGCRTMFCFLIDGHLYYGVTTRAVIGWNDVFAQSSLPSWFTIPPRWQQRLPFSRFFFSFISNYCVIKVCNEIMQWNHECIWSYLITI